MNYMTFVEGNKPPVEIWGSCTWYNPIDKIRYESDIYHKIWKGPNSKSYPMSKGTIYHNLISRNSYVLNETGWRIFQIAKKNEIVKEI